MLLWLQLPFDCFFARQQWTLANQQQQTLLLLWGWVDGSHRHRERRARIAAGSGPRSSVWDTIAAAAALLGKERSKLRADSPWSGDPPAGVVVLESLFACARVSSFGVLESFVSWLFPPEATPDRDSGAFVHCAVSVSDVELRNPIDDGPSVNNEREKSRCRQLLSWVSPFGGCCRRQSRYYYCCSRRRRHHHLRHRHRAACLP